MTKKCQKIHVFQIFLSYFLTYRIPDEFRLLDFDNLFFLFHLCTFEVDLGRVGPWLVGFPVLFLSCHVHQGRQGRFPRVWLRVLEIPVTAATRKIFGDFWQRIFVEKYRPHHTGFWWITECGRFWFCWRYWNWFCPGPRTSMSWPFTMLNPGCNWRAWLAGKIVPAQRDDNHCSKMWEKIEPIFHRK